MQHRFTIKLVEHDDGTWSALVFEAGQAVRSVYSTTVPNVLHEAAVLLVGEQELAEAA